MIELRATAPLLDAYLSYFETPSTPFTIPGHKQQAGRIDAGLGQVVDVDAPLYGGLDEVKLTRQLLRHAEQIAAECWGADWARFSTGGSTHANQAVIFALGRPGDRIAVSRTAHRSVLSALVLAGLEPIWMTPDIDEPTGVPMGISPAEFERALEHDPIALLLTEPGYLGTLSDLPPLIARAHAAGIPVIIDTAWGAHFGFHAQIPQHAMQLGADALVTSIHKSLPGYSASAMLLARTELLSIDRLEHGFETTHTTSPPGAPLASIDGCRALLQSRGEDLIGTLLANVTAFRQRVQSQFDVPVFLEASDFPAGRFDPTKLVLRVNQLGASGVEIERALLEHSIRIEMADHDTIIFMATITDTAADFDLLASALIPILKAVQGDARPSDTALSWSVVPQVAISMRDAYFANTEMVCRADAVGRISADLIAPYPPGVAVVAPGEVLTDEIVEGLTTSKDAGVRIAYASDPTLASYRVVRNER
ncbi:MAG: aminotransferase class V-fold PLP-dependent enzyme [Candidatus Nanopelagicales bacterium]|nr:aminotransferase class V-fold PLP-dependent enzyme [Candidatus Nanopelagicales bacterium]